MLIKNYISYLQKGVFIHTAKSYCHEKHYITHKYYCGSTYTETLLIFASLILTLSFLLS